MAKKSLNKKSKKLSKAALKQKELRKEYNKQWRNLQRRIKTIEKNEGIPPLHLLPSRKEKGEKIGIRDINKLLKWSSEKLVKESLAYKGKYGEIIPYTERKKEIRQKAKEKAQETKKAKEKYLKIKPQFIAKYDPSQYVLDLIRDFPPYIYFSKNYRHNTEPDKNDLIEMWKRTAEDMDAVELSNYLDKIVSDLQRNLTVIQHTSSQDEYNLSIANLAKLLEPNRDFTVKDLVDFNDNYGLEFAS